MSGKSIEMVAPDKALPGRGQEMAFSTTAHFVNQHEIKPPWPAGFEQAVFGMGCFWGAEKLFWRQTGVHVTAVGYAGGYTANPSYEEVCSGQTGHNEVVLVVFNPGKINYEQLLQVFWQGHDPTQTMRQGNDLGTQYRSSIYTSDDAQQGAAIRSKQAYQTALKAQDYSEIKTETVTAPIFYYAEEAHQQYLAKHVDGYCGLGGTGVEL